LQQSATVLFKTLCTVILCKLLIKNSLCIKAPYLLLATQLEFIKLQSATKKQLQL